MENKRILLVDDDSCLCDALRILIQSKGGLMHCIPDGTGIVRAILSFKPEIILLDYYLPKEDGVSIAAKLKANKETAHIPIIMISASLDVYERSKKAGVNMFLSKPFDVEYLISLVGKLSLK